MKECNRCHESQPDEHFSTVTPGVCRRCDYAGSGLGALVEYVNAAATRRSLATILNQIEEGAAVSEATYPAVFCALDSVLGLEPSTRSDHSYPSGRRFVWLARYFPHTGRWGRSAGESPYPRCYRMVMFALADGTFQVQLGEEDNNPVYAIREVFPKATVAADDVLPLLYQFIDFMTNSPEETSK